ncbi:hypothetical protein [Hymenobacter sp. BT491]|uniref:hypothetical protein n=1 Tax=Hymenobacter sp. BT491 TaxID=2766779 RepID=UPI001653C52D|nr:hypothetical protein [Hymenobacter sp. BT491]MBC6990366.1 hypothetical protein [Hymenobacter sp. BT491]
MQSESDSLSQKTTDELIFLARNPDYYHADIIAAARRELQRRGVNILTLGPPQAEIPVPQYAEEETPDRTWLGPALGIGILVVAVAAYFLFHRSPPPVVYSSKPIVLETVESHQIPGFEALTEKQVQRDLRHVPKAERANPSFKKNYLELSRRFWSAEHQSDYLLKQISAAKLDSAFPGQAALVYEKWHYLTKALLYSHKLGPVMKDRVDVMHDVANRRMSALSYMRTNYLNGQPVLDKQVADAVAPVDDMLRALRDTTTTALIMKHVDL